MVRSIIFLHDGFSQKAFSFFLSCEDDRIYSCYRVKTAGRKMRKFVDAFSLESAERQAYEAREDE